MDRCLCRTSVPGFLTPLPEVPGAVPQRQLPPQVAGLLDLIALAEAGPVPATLRRLVGIKGYGRDTRFSPDVQDQLALILLNEAGLEAFQARSLPRRAFMKNLARIWAGLPLPSGRSYYAGYAGNKLCAV